MKNPEGLEGAAASIDVSSCPVPPTETPGCFADFYQFVESRLKRARQKSHKLVNFH